LQYKLDVSFISQMVKTTHQYLLLLLWLIFVFGDFILTAEPLPPKM